MAVLCERDGRILKVTLNRPEVLNAIDRQTHKELVEAWTLLRDDPELRVAVLSGAGGRAFCAGVDVREMGAFYEDFQGPERRDARKREPGIGGVTRNLDPGKPIVAAIHGYCLGGGLELALACDLRIASPDATFGLPEVGLAIIPGQGGTQRLPRAVPPSVALEMILTGKPIPAARALEVGLVNRLVPRRALLREALSLARDIAAHSPRAVQTARTAVMRGLELPLERALELEQDLADPLRDSPENRAARARFTERRSRRRSHGKH